MAVLIDQQKLALVEAALDRDDVEQARKLWFDLKLDVVPEMLAEVAPNGGQH